MRRAPRVLRAVRAFRACVTFAPSASCDAGVTSPQHWLPRLGASPQPRGLPVKRIAPWSLGLLALAACSDNSPGPPGRTPPPT